MPERPDEMQTIQCAEDVARVVGDMRGLMQEQLRVLVLNNKHAVLEQRVIYQGTVNSCSIRVAEILRPAIVANAPAIVIVHNHPSGDPTPSPEDILVTRRIEQSAQLMDIELLDHIVLGESSLTSMKSMGVGLLDSIQQARASGLQPDGSRLDPYMRLLLRLTGC